MERPIQAYEFAAIDFESAGEMTGHTDVPVQVGIALMIGQSILDGQFFRSYIATDRPISWQAARVHGITCEDLLQAPQWSELWSPVRERLSGRVIVAHNGSTEKRFLGNFPLNRFGPWVDTLDMARCLYPGLSDYSLGALIGLFRLDGEVRQLCPLWNYHDACFDAVASLVLFKSMLDAGGLWSLPMDALLEMRCRQRL